MSDCCSPVGYRRIFSEKRARAAATRYRVKGLDSTSRRIVDLVVSHGAKGRSVLEVGGGIGAVQIELLRAGANHAVSVELTPTYEGAAEQLLRDEGLSDSVERRVVDLVAAGADVEAADIVVMNRVICCYPDMPRLVGAAADHCRDVLTMSFPKRTWWTRVLVSAGNIGLRLTKGEFHVFLHVPGEIRSTAELHGLRALGTQRGIFWEIAAWERGDGG
jgi:2-polyprenyl-3-methyl-5-hydroxy-6-metoxy-1,4-benzoquinol methylase